jgi:hypothetical protein
LFRGWEHDQHATTPTFCALTPPSAEDDSAILRQDFEAANSVCAEARRWPHSQASPSGRPPGPHGRRDAGIVGRMLARLYFGVGQPVAVEIGWKAFSAVSEKLQDASHSYVCMIRFLQELHCNACKRPRESARMSNIRSQMAERRCESFRCVAEFGPLSGHNGLRRTVTARRNDGFTA